MREFLRKLRRNHLLILFNVGFIITLGAILLEIDRNYFQMDKKRYIQENWYTLFPINKEEINLKARRILEDTDLESSLREKHIQQLGTMFSEIIQGTLSIYTVRLLDAEDNVILEKSNPEKLKEFNTFKNSLIFRNFHSKADNLIAQSVGRDTLGRLVVYYTTPLEDEYIQELTSKYRLYCLLIFIVLLLIYIYLVKYLLLPVRRVIGCLDKAKTMVPEIIRTPGSYLERVYNNLSRDALLSNINHRFNELASRIPLPQLSRVYEELPDTIISLFHYPFVGVFELKQNDEKGYRLLNCYYNKTLKEPAILESAKEELLRLVSEVPDKDITQLFDNKIKQTFINRRKHWLFVDIIHHGEHYENITCLVIVPTFNSERDLTDWDIETQRLIAREVRDGIRAVELHRQIIFKEKSETNVSLARRLGHDLTNIIATSKLDLMSIRKYLEMDDIEAIHDERKKEIFRSSLYGVLNNTRFLQEIVDIYRSFSFVKNPIYISLNLNRLVDEIVDVFQLAMSRNVRIVKHYQEDIPECVVEERLLKLAVFNLLNNAMEAISPAEGEEVKKSQIDIATGYNAKSDEMYLTIRDYGPGIRDDEGTLLSEGKLTTIFLPGYSTKSDDESEGMGLNWVWTIISDFHGGRIVPANCPDGGAQFTIYLNRSTLEKKMSSTPQENKVNANMTFSQQSRNTDS